MQNIYNLAEIERILSAQEFTKNIYNLAEIERILSAQEFTREERVYGYGNWPYIEYKKDIELCGGFWIIHIIFGEYMDQPVGRKPVSLATIPEGCCLVFGDIKFIKHAKVVGSVEVLKSS